MSGPKTTRDQLTLLANLLRKTTRHLWLVLLIVIIGAGLSILLAMVKKPIYSSETTLVFQEKISQSVLQGREVAQTNRSAGQRFKEMLLSRTTMAAVIDEFSLYPSVVKKEGTISAAEKLRLLVSFSDRGAGTYKISYRGSTAEEAQKITARLAAVLQEKDEKIRKDQAEQTKIFLGEAVVSAENTLLEAEQEFAGFIAKNPQFVKEAVVGGAGIGAGIRDSVTKKSTTRRSGGSRLSALQRAARRIKDRIANPGAPVSVAVNSRRIESPALRQARDELARAKRNYRDKSLKYAAQHPDVVAAKNGIGDLTRAVRRLEAIDSASARSVKSSVTSISASANVAELQRELSRINAEISRTKSSAKNGDKPTVTKNSIAEALIDLETEHVRLQRKMEGAAQRLSSLEARAFTADITASSEFAEAAKLIIVDKAYLPAKPMGKGRSIVVIAGVLVFGFIGIGLAIGLALIDDRVYLRGDIDHLGIAPVLVVIPKKSKRKKKKRKFRG